MWISVAFVIGAVDFMFFKNHDYVFATIFAILFVAVLFFYPTYMRYRYRDRLQKMLREQYRGKPNKPVTVTFTAEGIEAADANSISKFGVAELEKVYETGEYFYILFGPGSLFIPKSKITDPESVGDELKAIAEKVRAEYHTELNWRWK